MTSSSEAGVRGKASSTAAALAGMGMAGGAAYLLVAGQRLRTWGTRADEATRPLPSEELTPEPGAALTHAITIDARPDEVWPWVAQLGQDKGGFYSYAWLENLSGAGIVNADRIEPAWQHPHVGGQIKLHPTMGLPIAQVVPGERLVVIKPITLGLGFHWIFIVSPEGSDATRLLVRERYVVPWAPARAVAHLVVCGSAVMSRKMLLGIRERAERQSSVSSRADDR